MQNVSCLWGLPGWAHPFDMLRELGVDTEAVEEGIP